MAYEKQEWNCGDTITAEKMNHIEEGIENASQGGGTTKLTVRVMLTGDDSVMDKTWQEISDAFPNVEVVFNADGGLHQAVVKMVSVISAIPIYQVVVDMPNQVRFTTATSNGHPTHSVDEA